MGNSGHGASGAVGSRFRRTARKAAGGGRNAGAGGSAIGRSARHAVEALETRCLLSNTPLISEFVALNNTGL